MKYIKSLFSFIKPRTSKFIFCYAVLIYFELLFRASTVGALDNRFFYVLLFCIPIALILFMITSVCKPVINKIIFNTVIGIITLYFSVHTVYYTVFKDFLSIYSIGTGADVMANFAKQTMIGIKDSAISILLLLIPLAASILLTVTNKFSFERVKYYFSISKVVSAIAIHALCILILFIFGSGPMGAYENYMSIYTGTRVSIYNFGVLQTAGLEIKALLFGESSSDINIDSIEDKYYSIDEYHAYPISFNEIFQSTNDQMVKELCLYASQREPTNKNQYSGYFEGYNLITICAESFSPYLIDEELTPTLYRLANEG